MSVAAQLPGVPGAEVTAVAAAEGLPAQRRAVAAQAGREYFIVRRAGAGAASRASLGIPGQDPPGTCGVGADTC